MTFLIIVFILVLLTVIVMFNSLVTKRNRVQNTYAGIDVQLKKRYDLVPNMVAAVKGYMTHERAVFEELAALRASAMRSGADYDERIRIDNRMSGLLGNLMVQVEAYPQLRASENVMHLQRTLNEIEEQIAAIRRTYNAAVTDYNTAIELFPTNLLAGGMGFRRHELFSISETEKAPAKVNLNHE